MLGKTLCKVKSSQRHLQECFHLYHTLKKIYNFWRNFIFKSPIFMILKTFRYAKLLSELNTALVHIVIMSGKFVLHFGLAWNLMLSCKHKDLSKMLCSLRKNCRHFFNSKKTEYSNKLPKRLMKNKIMEKFLWIHYSSKKALKNVLGARHPNSSIDQSFDSWPLEPLEAQLARANKKQQNCNWSYLCICSCYIRRWHYWISWIFIWW